MKKLFLIPTILGFAAEKPSEEVKRVDRQKKPLMREETLVGFTLPTSDCASYHLILIRSAVFTACLPPAQAWWQPH